MDGAKAEVLFHPVRMRIVLALASAAPITAQQLGERLRDVPQATLYRHLNKLSASGIVRVVEERPVRGAVERVYALHPGGAVLTQPEIAHASKEDHLRYFTTFLGTVLADFARYVSGNHVDFAADGAGYRQIPLYLSDEELARVRDGLNAALLPVLRNGPAPDRRRRVLTTILIPSDGDSGAAATG